MAKKTVIKKTKIELKIKGGAGLILALLLGMGEYHVQPYNFLSRSPSVGLAIA